MVFTSAFFTAIIGVHPIFGAFLVGIICPHDGGFAIKLTEKIEDLVAVFFLPLYFALSGLSTNIGLLDNGITWAYVIGIITVAFVGKMVGGTLAARSCKMVWRESFTIGALMSCKGLVELIVLNIGLQAKILSQRTFTIFVVMALVTTFVITPLVSALYPPWYQKKLAAWKRGEIDWDENRLDQDGNSADDSPATIAVGKTPEIRKLLVCLRLDSLPSLFTFVSLLSGEGQAAISKPKAHPAKNGKSSTTAEESFPDIHKQRPLEIHGLRMLELTERLSSVMKESEVDEWSTRDPVVNAFYTFGSLSNVAVSGEVQLVPIGSYASLLNERASQRGSDMILLPWSETGSISENSALGFVEPAQNAFGNDSYNHLVAKMLASAPCNTAVFVSNGFGALPREEPKHGITRALTGQSMRSEHMTTPIIDRSHHIFFAFTGGLDDQVALRFVLRLAKSPNVTATILLVNDTSEGEPTAEIQQPPTPKSPTAAKSRSQLAIVPVRETVSEQDKAFFYSIRDSLPDDSVRDRVVFDTVDTTKPLSEIPERARSEIGLSHRNAGDLVVVGRGASSGGQSGDVLRATLGDWADAMISASVKGSVIVVQGRRN